jgi:hypothetical protein
VAVKNQALRVPYTAWDTVNNVPVTGDAANHVLVWTSQDGVDHALASPVIHETGAGKYSVEIDAGSCNTDSGFLSGTSTTPGVVLIGGWATFESGGSAPNVSMENSAQDTAPIGQPIPVVMIEVTES